MQRVFRVVSTSELNPTGVKTTAKFVRSIRRYGIVNPIIAAEVVDSDGVIGLRIVDGNRRVRAAKSAGLLKVPAVVLKEVSASDRARLTLICNHMRSMNFHTESRAITALAIDEDGAERASRSMELAPGKILKLFQKIDCMPEDVRQAMYEHRMPVTAATWVGSWPEELQDEVVELLGRRRHLDTRALRTLRQEYYRLHPQTDGPQHEGSVHASVLDRHEDSVNAQCVSIGAPSPSTPISVDQVSTLSAEPISLASEAASSDEPVTARHMETLPPVVPGIDSTVASPDGQLLRDAPRSPTPIVFTEDEAAALGSGNVTSFIGTDGNATTAVLSTVTAEAAPNTLERFIARLDDR